MCKSLTAALAVVALALSAHPGSAQTGMQAKVEIPAAITPPGMTSYLTVPAKGVQIYTCGKNAAGAWAAGRRISWRQSRNCRERWHWQPRAAARPA